MGGLGGWNMMVNGHSSGDTATGHTMGSYERMSKYHGVMGPGRLEEEAKKRALAAMADDESQDTTPAYVKVKPDDLKNSQ